MILSYRARCALKRIATVLMVLLIIAAAAVLIWTLWLGRYVLYTRDGAVLDYSMSSADLTGTPVQAPEPEEPVSIFYNEGSNAVDVSQELKQLSGYYITGKELEEDLDGVYAQLRALPAGTPVMIDVKSIYGNFFYSSTVSGQRNGDLDIQAMDELIEWVNSTGLYTIARLPALRDFHYGLNNVSDGLPVAAGYLWMDTYGCYWLNPASEGTVTYLIQIANELKHLGFDEVVFYDYYFPATDKIVFKGDKAQALTDAAQTLVTACATDSFAVSFTCTGSGIFTPPTGRSRIYLEGISAANVELAAQGFEFENKPVNLVFLTDVQDTRYDAYGVLRPIDDVH